jgi:hypothetical protein
MAQHRLSAADRAFCQALADGQLAPADFTHRAHLRLAYCHLAHADPATALPALREAIRHFLAHHGIDAAKYHETLTQAWLLAVHHFLQGAPPSDCADAFIDQHACLLDPQILLTHYSAERLFSSPARQRFLEPDRDPIPRYGS